MSMELNHYSEGCQFRPLRFPRLLHDVKKDEIITIPKRLVLFTLSNFSPPTVNTAERDLMSSFGGHFDHTPLKDFP